MTTATMELIGAPETEKQAIEKSIVSITDQALAVRVTDPASCTIAGDLLLMHKDMQKKIEAFFEPHVKKANELHKSLTAARAAEIAKLKPGMDHLNKEMTAYHIEEDRKRREEEARLRAEALKREEEERLAAAVQAEAEGDAELADAIITEPVHVAAPVVHSAAPKTAGLSMVSTWKSEVVSLIQLVKAIAEGKAPITCIQANDTFLNNQARSGKGQITYPGVRFYEEKSMRGVRR